MSQKFPSLIQKSMLLGQVWPGVKKNAAKVKVKKMVLDTNLNMVSKTYFVDIL